MPTSQKLSFSGLIFLSLFIFALNTPIAAQQSNLSVNIIPIPDVYEPILLFPAKKRPPQEENIEPNFSITQINKEALRQMSAIYELQIKAMRAEVENNPLAAEKYILEALSKIKTLLNQQPDIKQSKRFAALYGAVYTEYRQFYGIDKAINESIGKIFAIREELVSTNINTDKFTFPNNLKTYGLIVPLSRNEQVKRHLLFFTQKHRDVMETWLKRTKKYFPMMRREFKKIGAPAELVHLSMIESGLNPRAQSSASATGMWQFMEATGEAYGLAVNWWVDERRDPVKSTRAAARHLKDLYERWGDWHLAIAGYNISPRGLLSAIREGGGNKNYWEAWPYLPNETQGYIPGFIAATMVELNPEKFGFKSNYDVKPYSYKLVTVAPLMPLDLLAKAAGISLQKLKEYNPELLRWATPPGSPYKLKLPPEITDTFLANYSKIPEDARSQRIVMHTIRSGENLGYIANKYDITVRALYETNKGLSSLIFPGQKIIIPLPGVSKTQRTIASNDKNKPAKKTKQNHSKSSNSSSSQSKVYYTVKKGDSIGYIAEWYDVRASQIRRWNNTSNSIDVGDRLAIYVPKRKVDYYKKITTYSFAKKNSIEQKQKSGTGAITINYKVRNNDTLIEIAQAFNVSVASIKRANGLNGSRIYVGQHLQINTAN